MKKSTGLEIAEQDVMVIKTTDTKSRNFAQSCWDEKKLGKDRILTKAFLGCQLCSSHIQQHPEKNFFSCIGLQ